MTPPADLDPAVTVFQLTAPVGEKPPELKEIGRADNGIRGEKEELQLTLVEAGTYFLQVKDYYCQMGSFSTKPYTLLISYPAFSTSLKGEIHLEGRLTPGFPVAVKLLEPVAESTCYTAISDPNGSFQMAGIKPGTYVLVFTFHGFLEARREIEVFPAQETLVDNLMLYAGDLDGDRMVNLTDLTLVARVCGSRTDELGDEDRVADLNADGKVNLYDFVLLTRNYGKEGTSGGNLYVL